MADEAQRGKPFMRVKHTAGNDWLSPIDALKNRKDASEEEVERCVDVATVRRDQVTSALSIKQENLL